MVEYASLKYNTYTHLYFKLPKMAKAPLIKDKAKFTPCNLLF